MNHVQVISLVLLAALLILSISRRINIGLLGIAAVTLIVFLSDISVKQVYREFPAGIFTLLLGISLLFSHFERSGGLPWIIKGIYSAIGSRTFLIPWAGFALGAIISTAGAFSPAPIALLVPIIAAVSMKYPKLFFISEMGVIVGANVAGLSPLNPTGNIVIEAAKNAHVSYNPWIVWAFSIVMGAIFVAILQNVFKTRHMYEADPAYGNKRPPSAHGRFLLIRPIMNEEENAPALQPFYASVSGLAVLLFVVLVVFFHSDIGLTATSLAVLLMIFFPRDNKLHLQKVPWNAIIVLCGLLTYVKIVQDLGTMDAIQYGLISMTSNPLVLMVIIAYLVTLLSNIESSTLGVMALMAPMLFGIIGPMDHIALIVAAIMGPPTLSVVNPIHAAGTLVMAYTDEAQQNAAFRRNLILSGIIVVVVPGIAVLLPLLTHLF
ncbi:hypothetical protein LMG33818_000196 [Halomonadaceae bacterium LMG 33818]|uniref:SLC13 family permease n=1 Tax=Cernens ardua TaxID=3402176 RepID=UPI003EDCA8F7